MPAAPLAVFVIPVYNSAASLARCVTSALRQKGIGVRVVVVDHGSADATPAVAADLAARHPEVEVVTLARTPDEAKSPSRPLNAGMRRALELALRPDRTWVFRLDVDDFIAADTAVADQLRAGEHRELIMATLTFFDPRRCTAFEYGPRLRHRTLAGLPGRDVWAVAHHSTAMRADLLTAVWPQGDLYDPMLETGEDLGVTCRLLRALDGDESRFAFVPAPYCYKGLAKETITGSLPLGRVLASHKRLLRDHREIAVVAVLRGLAETWLSRLVGEALARRSLQHLAGRNGHYRAVPYADVARRMNELPALG